MLVVEVSLCELVFEEVLDMDEGVLLEACVVVEEADVGSDVVEELALVVAEEVLVEDDGSLLLDHAVVIEESDV